MITLPWSVLVPDNRKHAAVNGRLILTKEYRSAQAGCSALVAAQWKEQVLTGPVRVVIVVYEPDRRRRDIANFSKQLGDVMTGLVYVDDSQIDDIRFVRGALDRKNPRAEIQVAPL